MPPINPHYFDVQLCVSRNTAHTHTMLSLNAYDISLPNRAHIVMQNFCAVSTWQKALMDTVGGSGCMCQ